MSWLLLFGGLALLVVGGDLLIRASTNLAQRFGLSPAIIGLTVVAIGSSLPELAVGIDAARRGATGLVVGNIVGTNIVNLALILGLSAALRPFVVRKQMQELDTPFVVGTTALLFLLSLNGELATLEGTILLLIGVAYTYLVVRYVRRRGDEDALAEEFEAPRALWLDLVILVVALGLVIWGADVMVTGAVQIAQALGVSDTVIGLTIVAIGTSAPELVTTIVATIRNQAAMAIGNLIGSSVYNIVFILGAASVLAGAAMPITGEVLFVDMIVLLLLSVVVLIMFRTHDKATRVEGIVLMLGYVAYLIYLITVRA